MQALYASAGLFLLATLAGCPRSSEIQRTAVIHQNNSDIAAQNGQYGIAASEQRKAQNQHHKAVNKAIDEGNPIPPQTKIGDPAPAPLTN
jgi:hypothetical protein